MRKLVAFVPVIWSYAPNIIKSQNKKPLSSVELWYVKIEYPSPEVAFEKILDLEEGLISYTGKILELNFTHTMQHG